MGGIGNANSIETILRRLESPGLPERAMIVRHGRTDAERGFPPIRVGKNRFALSFPLALDLLDYIYLSIPFDLHEQELFSSRANRYIRLVIAVESTRMQFILINKCVAQEDEQ